LMTDDKEEEKMGEVIRIDEARIKDHLGEMVRGTVEEALNAFLGNDVKNVPTKPLQNQGPS